MRITSILLVICLLGVVSVYAGPPTQSGQTILHQDDFAQGSDPWTPFTEGTSTLTLYTDGAALVGTFDTALQSAAGILRPLLDVDGTPQGVSLTLQAEGRPFALSLGVLEADNSWYNTSIFINPADGPRRIDIDFDWLRLGQDTEDENDQLDLDQVIFFTVVDASGFIGPMGAGSVRLSEVAFWQGTAPAPDITCSAQTATTNDFLVGVDASYIPQGEKVGATWLDGDTPIADPVVYLADRGVEALRLRVWVGDAALDEALALAQRAADAGIAVYPVLFLSEDWSDVTKQPAPAAWVALSIPERAEAIRAYTQATVGDLLATGIAPPYYEIGNEIDFGIAGVFAETGQRDLITLQNTIWPDQALLIQAAIEGVRAADPDAKIMLHIAQSWNPQFAAAFFGAMRQHNVQYDIAGLSFYAPAQGVLAFDGFCRTLDWLHAEFQTPAVIAEWAYSNSSTRPTELFSDWRNVVPGYPATSAGQADFVAHFLRDMRDHPAVIGAYYFSPTFYWASDVWQTFALFGPDGRALPAWDEFDLP